MPNKPSRLSLALVLGLSSAGGPVVRLVRGVILVRLAGIGPADFGVATVFGLTTTLVELVSNFGAERLLIQDDRGDEERFGRSVQLFMLLRGLLLGCLLLALAPWVAWWFNVEHATWALRALAVVPVLHGLANRDISRVQRDLRYMPSTATTVGSDLIGLLVAVPTAFSIPDYRAFLVASLATGAARLVLSHVLAERRFGLAWEPAVFRRVFNFGWPLLLNGVAMFLVARGDRLVIGRALSTEELAWYAAASNLAMVGGGMAVAALSRLALPVLARVKTDDQRFAARFDQLHGLAVVGACSLGLTLGLLGPEVIALLYGPQYTASGPLLQLLGLSQAFFILRVINEQAMVARGDTKRATIGMGVRALALPVLVLAMSAAAGAHAAAVLALVGEAAAAAVSYVVVARGYAVDIRSVVTQLALPCYAGALVGLMHGIGAAPLGPAGRVAATAATLAASLGVYAMTHRAEAARWVATLGGGKSDPAG